MFLSSFQNSNEVTIGSLSLTLRILLIVKYLKRAAFPGQKTVGFGIGQDNYLWKVLGCLEVEGPKNRTNMVHRNNIRKLLV